MKARMPSLMKLADDREEVLFREALMEGRRGTPTDFATDERWEELKIETKTKTRVQAT